MSWTGIAVAAVFALLGRLILVRAFGCVIWLLILFLALLAAVPLVRADAPEWQVLHAIPLAPPLDGPPSDRNRRAVLAIERTFALPPLPPDAQLWLSGDRPAPTPFTFDDTLRMGFASAGREHFVLEHDFRNASRKGIEPYGPVNLTGLLPAGLLTVTVRVTDVQPPHYHAGALYLLVLVPSRTPTPITETATPSLPAATPTGTPSPQPGIPRAEPTGTAVPSGAGSQPPGGGGDDPSFWAMLAAAVIGATAAGRWAISFLTGRFWAIVRR